MLTYLITNSLITASILLVSRSFPASIKIRYWFTTIALACWLIPYELLASLLPQNETIAPVWLIPLRVIADASETQALAATSQWSFSQTNLFILLLTIGAVILVKRLSHLYFWQKRILVAPSTQFLELPGNQFLHPVYTNEQVSSAMVFGLFNPKIIISRKLANSDFLPLVISHESQHIASRDHWKLSILQVFQSLFWWNPLVIALTNELHLLIEVNCDLNTSKQFGQQNYLRQISSLMLDSALQTNRSLAIPGILNRKLNIKRIRLIKENTRMNAGKKFIYGFLALTLLGGISTSVVYSQAKWSDKSSSELAESLIDEPITLNFESIPLNALAEIISEFAEFTQVKIEPGIQNNAVSLKANSIPLAQLFAKLEESYNLIIDVSNDTLSIESASGGMSADHLVDISESDPLGALIEFQISYSQENAENKNTRTANLKVWTEFNKPAFIRLGEDWQLSIKTNDQSDRALLDMQILDTRGDSPELKLLAEPKLITAYNKMATVEMRDEHQNSFIKVEASVQKVRQPVN